MKDYVNYMDTIAPPPSLRERLSGLRAPKKRLYPALAAAAALVLAVGVGALAASRRAALPENELGTEPAIDYDHGDYYPEPSEESDAPPKPTPGGLDVSLGEGPEGSVLHIVLPCLDFADCSDSTDMVAADYILGEINDFTRDVTTTDLEQIFGPMWREYMGLAEDWTIAGSTLFFTDSAEPCGMSLALKNNDGEYYDIEILKGYDVPSCYILPDDASGHTNVDGVDVTAVDDARSCTVSLFAGGCGYKATIGVGRYAATVNMDNYHKLAAAFVRLVVDRPQGFGSVMYDYPHDLVPDPSTDVSAPTPPGPGAAITPGYDPTK